MFDIGWTELLIIAVVAIIVVGPKDLPGMLRSLGRYAGKMKRTAGEFRSQFDDALRDSELDELRSAVSDMGDLNPVNQIRDSVTDTLNPLKETADDIKSGIEDFGSAGAKADSSGKTANPDDAGPARAAKKPAAKTGKKTAAAKAGGAKPAASAKSGAAKKTGSARSKG